MAETLFLSDHASVYLCVHAQWTGQSDSCGIKS